MSNPWMGQVWELLDGRMPASGLREEAGHGSSAANPTVVSPAISGLVDLGIVFGAGGRHTIASGSSGAIHLDNPSDSGVKVTIVGFSAYNDATGAANITFFQGATLQNSPTTRTAFNLHFGSANTSATTVSTGESILTGGTSLSAVAKVVRDNNFEFQDLKIVLPQGETAAMQVNVPGALSSQVLDFNVQWFEEAV